MVMRYRGGGVGHKSTRNATNYFLRDRDDRDIPSLAADIDLPSIVVTQQEEPPSSSAENEDIVMDYDNKAQASDDEEGSDDGSDGWRSCEEDDVDRDELDYPESLYEEGNIAEEEEFGYAPL